MHRYRHEVVDLGIFAASKQYGTIYLQNLPEFSVLEQPHCSPSHTSTNDMHTGGAEKAAFVLTECVVGQKSMVNLVTTLIEYNADYATTLIEYNATMRASVLSVCTSNGGRDLDRTADLKGCLIQSADK